MARKPSYPYPAPSTLDPEEVKRTKAVLKHTEKSGAEPTTLDHAGTKKSGFSVGISQIDLAANDKKRGELVAALKASEQFNDDEINSITSGFETQGNKDALGDDLKQKIEAQLKNGPVKDLVARWDDDRAKEVTLWANETVEAARTNPRYQTDEEFRRYVDSDEFKVLVADNANQFDRPDQLKKWVAGETVAINGRPTTLGNKLLNFEAFAEYESQYEEVQKGAKGASQMRNRRERTIEAMKQQGILSEEQAQERMATIDGRYRAPGEPPGLSTLRPEPRPEGRPGQPDAPHPTAPEPPQASPAAGEQSPPAQPPQIQPEALPQPASDKEQKGAEAPADPRLAAMTKMAATPIANPGQSALLKPVDKLTESEMRDMIASAQGDYRGWRSGDPLKAHTYEKVQDWHVNIYGDQP